MRARGRHRVGKRCVSPLLAHSVGRRNRGDIVACSCFQNPAIGAASPAPLRTQPFALSDARAARTAASGKPNCRAICVSFTPALKAARTALSLPVVRCGSTPSTFGGLRTDRSSPSCFPRRYCSVSAAVTSRSSSSSSRYLINQAPWEWRACSMVGDRLIHRCRRL